MTPSGPTRRVRADISRLCREEEFAAPEYGDLCRELDIPIDHYERKNWEYFFVAQALKEDDIAEVASGLLRGRPQAGGYFASRAAGSWPRCRPIIGKRYGSVAILPRREGPFSAESATSKRFKTPASNTST
jgi:hypothetical protein